MTVESGDEKLAFSDAIKQLRNRRRMSNSIVSSEVISVELMPKFENAPLLECVVCHQSADAALLHKGSMEEYPFCQACANKGFFNPDIFDFVATH